MAPAFERSGQIEPQAIGEPGDVVAGRHALHAADPEESAVVALFGDERIAVSRLDVTITGERLLEGHRQAHQQAGYDSQHQETSSLGGGSLGTVARTTTVVTARPVRR
jgi:hypothetical protein